MAVKPITVSQLNEFISKVLETDPLLGNITVRGEVSGTKYHSSGHVYFNLVDATSQVNCFFSRNNLSVVDFRITDGMALIIHGSITVYKQGGRYSLFVRGAEKEGEGALAAAFEKMKQKLAAEGLFDTAHKKSLPPFPGKVGVITAESGAAIRDIIKNITKKNSLVDIVLYPVQVQGEGAAEAIARAIGFANTDKTAADVLIVGRGGGSPEDLAAFNEECVARAIYDSKIPVISAVGHEIDFTISDFVADVRAETPTAGAQMAVPDTGELLDTVTQLQETLLHNLRNNLMYHRLLAGNLRDALTDKIGQCLREATSRAETYRLLLEENSPLSILQSGYAIVEDPDGRVVTNPEIMSRDKVYKVTLAEGSINMEISKEGQR